MRFAAVLGTRDELDILPDAIEQLRRIGIERIVILDIGSTDGTLEYLAEAEAAGDIWTFHVGSEVPEDVRRGSRAALGRATEADWVLFLDSDEIPLPRGGTLHDLADLEGADIVSVPRYNVVLGPDGPCLPLPTPPERYRDVLVYAQPIADIYHHTLREPDTPWIRGVLEPKVMARWEAIAGLQLGSHDIDVEDGRHWRRAVASDLLLAHVPFRTLERFALRSANVQETIDAGPEWFSGYTGWQWVRYAKMAAEGRTEEEFDRQRVDDAELARLLDEHVVRSVLDLFEEPIPAIRSEERYVDMARRAEPWLTATAMVCRRERIEPAGKLEHISGKGQFPAVVLPPDRVVKFYTPWLRGRETREREITILRLLEADPQLPVPRLVADGELRDDLWYVVMSKVPGVTFRSIEYDIDAANHLEVADWLGRFMRRLGDVTVPDDRRERGWDWFREIAEWRHAQVGRFTRERGFSATLVERLEGWLPPLDALMGRPEDAVVCHGDLNDSNLMGQPAVPRFEPTGVIDLNQAYVGEPLSDLGAIWWHVLRRDRTTLEAFLAASGLRARVEARVGDDFARHALAWTLMTPFWTKPDVEDVAGIDDPGELAERWFGSS